MNNNTCKYCGKGLNANYRSKLYCSQECGYKYRYRKKAGVSKKCQHCNEAFKPNENGAKYKYCSDECFNNYRRKDNRERWRKQNPDWNKVVSKECEYCRKDYTVENRHAHRSKFCSDKCNDTWWSRQKGHRPLNEWISIREEQKRKRQARLEKERAIRSLRATLTKVIKLKEEDERIIELTRECEECGIMFYDPHPNTLTCSSKCSRKRRNRVIRYNNRNRINEHNLVDKDISLKRLYKRDKGMCYLCGERCDYNDRVITDEGHYIAGRMHPSIDHVKPLSKGGKHAWNNVKLAHHYCNTIKNDNQINIEFEALV